MFKRFIQKFFGFGNAKNEQIFKELYKKSDAISSTQAEILTNFKEHIKTLELSLTGHTNKIKQEIKNGFVEMEASLNPPKNLTIRERLALDYAKKLFSWRVLYYPNELKTDKKSIGGKEKTSQEHYADAARESVIYADKIIKASREPKKV